MYVAALSPGALVKLCEAPQLIDPTRRDVPGNRPLDKDHLTGIVNYLEHESDFVIGGVTLYVKKGVVRFEAVGPPALDRSEIGTFEIPIDARISIGDGQHRLRAYEQILQTRDADDPIVSNLKGSSSPAIFVEEDNPVKIAQDFVDLQHNVKPLSSSLGASLDRRLRINALALDLAAGSRLLSERAPGDRIESLGATLRKLSPRIYTFASWRWAIGTVVSGFHQRGRRRWEQALDRALAAENYASWLRRLTEVFCEAETSLPGWRDVVRGSMSVPFFRQRFVLGSAAGLNALAGALHHAAHDSVDLSVMVQRVAQVDWLKSPSNGVKKVFFEGSIVQRGKVISNRPAFEAAARKLYLHATRTRD